MKKHNAIYDYALATGAAAICTVVSFAIFPRFALLNLVMIYLLGTVAVAARGRRGPAALSSALNVFCFDFFFVPPRFSITVSDAEYLFTFAVMFTAAMMISHLTIRLRSEAESARKSESQTTAMHEFTQKLAAAHGLDHVLTAAFDHMTPLFDGAIAAFVPDQQARLEFKTSGPDAIMASEKDFGVAQWVYEKDAAAGLGSRSLPSSAALYVPLRGTGAVLGVLRVQPRNGQPLSIDQQRLLDSFSRQIALALEVDRLQENARRVAVEVETERLRSALLSSVSHDFRTPLTAIVGSASTLLERDDIRNNPKAAELIETIQDEGERLSRQIDNLLEATRLDAGTVKLRKEHYPLEEIIGSALARVEKTLKGRDVGVTIETNLPAPLVDGLLLEQVFINLLENAARHTSPDAIAITAEKSSGAVLVSVLDRGPGLAADELERVFDKFYRRSSSPGAGLGLSICRAIVKAHGGRIWAENRDGGGAMFRFALPLDS